VSKEEILEQFLGYVSWNADEAAKDKGGIEG
jgi:hypothetical protein